MNSGEYSHHHWEAEEYHQHSSAQYEATKELLKFLNLKGNEHILDVGCGDGKISAKISKNLPLGSIIGIDISQEMIKFAQKTFPKNNYSNLEFFVNDAQELNFNENFDIIFSSFALQWLPKPNIFFKSAFKSLKVSGCLALTIPLGISSALEQAVESMIKREEWLLHFRDFSPNWYFIPDNEYAQMLMSNNFKTNRFEVVQQTVMFPSREIFEKYVIQWFSYLRPLPHHLKNFFFNQVIDNYIELEPISKNGEVRFMFPRVDIIATKATL